MKVLLIANNFLSADRLRRIFLVEGIQSEVLVEIEPQVLRQKIEELASKYELIVLNRMNLKIEDYPCLQTNHDLFCLLDELKEMAVWEGYRRVERCKIFVSPFDYNLLCLTIKSIGFMNETKKMEFLSCGKIKLDINCRYLIYDDKRIQLKNREFELMKYLMLNQGRVLSRINILENVWDMNASVMTNTVDVHVSRLRSMIKEHFGLENVISTIQCVGYILS